MCEIDLEPCEVWIPTERTAKKPHKCEACGRAIQPGERYHHTFTVFEGHPSTSKHCADCQRDIGAFAKAHDGMSPFPSSLIDVVVECIENAELGEERRWKAMLQRIRMRGGRHGRH